MDLRLIVITDRRLASPRSILEIVEAALQAGAPAIQLRDKAATAREFYEHARALREATARWGALLLVNDRLDVALAANADGVHLGPDDLPIDAARLAAPRPFLIGASTDDPEAARRLEAQGADYIGCGAVFGTTTKDVGEERIGPERVAAVAAAVSIPVVAIGGIDAGNAHLLRATGVTGVAAVRAIMAAPDPAGVTRALLAAFGAGYGAGDRV